MGFPGLEELGIVGTFLFHPPFAVYFVLDAFVVYASFVVAYMFSKRVGGKPEGAGLSYVPVGDKDCI